MIRKLVPVGVMMGLVTAAVAAEPVEILRCKSDDAILSVYKTKKNYLASLVSPMTPEKIEKMFPGTNLDEEMIKLLLAQKPANQIPVDYRTYDSFDVVEDVVKNGFVLTGKNVKLSLVRNDQDRIDLRFSFEKKTRSMTESRSGTLPLGSSSAVVCESMSD